jgi:RNase P subunit RPR2
MAWKMSQILKKNNVALLKIAGTTNCKHCGDDIVIGKQYMRNKHATTYGSKTKWYCMPCYDRMFH